MLQRSVGEFGGINTRPELTPADDVQGHMNAMSAAGGGAIYLGPYDFQIQSEATSTDYAAQTSNYWSIPEGVSLVGVPNRTRIFKIAHYNEIPGYVITPRTIGPVVALTGDRAGIYNCIVYLDTYENANAATPPPGLYKYGTDPVVFGFSVPDAGGAVDITDTSEFMISTSINFYNFCYILIEPTYDSAGDLVSVPQDTVVNGCIIGKPELSTLFQVMPGIIIGGDLTWDVDTDNWSQSFCRITNNRFQNDIGISPVSGFEWLSAGVYIVNGIMDVLVSANVGSVLVIGTTGEEGALVSVANTGHADMNTGVIYGNVPAPICTSTTNGWRT